MKRTKLEDKEFTVISAEVTRVKGIVKISVKYLVANNTKSVNANTYILPCKGKDRRNTITRTRARACTRARTYVRIKEYGLKVKKDKEIEYLPIAKRLYQIVCSKKYIKIDSRKLKNWAAEIRLLNTKDDISLDRIEDALDWYEDNIGGEFVPVIESGSSFRSKFLRLENAIERFSKKKEKVEKYKYYDGIKYRVGEDGRLYHARTGTLFIP
jgi:hypothetical protein